MGQLYSWDWHVINADAIADHCSS